MPVAIPGRGEVLFCHAPARNDTETFTRLTPDEAHEPRRNLGRTALYLSRHAPSGPLALPVPDTPGTGNRHIAVHEVECQRL
jgi:hypothetical protein